MSDALLEAFQRAARDLPLGYQISLTVEQGAGWVVLTAGGDIVNDEPCPNESFANQVHELINEAIGLEA